jgi:hypothetical protein
MDRDGRLSRRAMLRNGVIAATASLAGCPTGSGSDEQGPSATFDGGKEEWSAVDLVSHETTDDPDWSSVEAQLDVTHVADGGVENSGHVKRVDTTGNAFFFDAPDTFLGDKSAFAGGTLTFFLRSTHNNYRADSAVLLVGADGVVVTQFDTPDPTWTTFEVSIDAGTRTFRNGNLDGSEAAQSDVEAVLSDLRALRISGEHGGAVEEEVGLDEVRLQRP